MGNKPKYDAPVEDAEIVEAERHLEELRAKQAGRGHAEYPKMIAMEGDPTSRVVVNSKEEEDRHQGQVVKAFDLTPEEQAAEQGARAEADKEAAKGKSRLAGPENGAKGEKANDKAKARAAKAKPLAPKSPGLLARAAAKVTGKGK